MILYFQRENTQPSQLTVLPATYQTLKPQATELCVACVMLPPDVSTGIGPL